MSSTSVAGPDLPGGASGRVAGTPEDAPVLEVRSPGVVPYREALERQEALVRARRAGEVPDQLLLLEHPHVITLGSSARPEHVLVNQAERRRRGVELVETGRGGDVTYHGPGQLVGYPIFDLKPDRKDLHRYLRDLETALIEAVEALGLPAHRSDGYTGVWTSGRKVAAIGVRVSSGWITSHGFALNVTTDLSWFDAIVPCGLHGRPVTSLERELGRRLELAEVGRSVARSMARTFGRRLRSA